MEKFLPKLCGWCPSFQTQYGDWIDCPEAVDLIRRASLATGEKLSHGMCDCCSRFQLKQIERLTG